MTESSPVGNGGSRGPSPRKGAYLPWYALIVLYALLAWSPFLVLEYFDTVVRDWFIGAYGLRGCGSAPFNWLLRAGAVGVHAVLSFLLVKMTTPRSGPGRAIFWGSLAYAVVACSLVPLSRYVVR